MAHEASRRGDAATPLMEANAKKVGHAASVVGMAVSGTLVGT